MTPLARRNAVFTEEWLRTFVGERAYQSVDFTSGRELLEKLKAPGASDDPLLFVGALRASPRVLVLESGRLQQLYTLRDTEVLLVLQKLARFAIKIWDNLTFSPAEMRIAGKTEAKHVIFPLPLSSASGFRLAIDRVGDDGHDHLLVYFAGTDEGEGADFIPSRAGLNAGLLALRSRELVGSSGASATSGSYVAVADLGAVRRGASGLEMPRARWSRFLSEPQRLFADRPLRGPERLQGPAGTGKTLGLLLKALNTLAESRASEVESRLLILAHSTSTKNSILERLAVLDAEDQLLGDTASRSALGSLEVRTLQEQCIRYLGTDLGEAEILDPDALRSKEYQLLILVELLENRKAALVKTFSPLISDMFRLFLEKEEDFIIAEMLRREIGEVIKGRSREQLDVYRRAPVLRAGLPLQTDADRGLVFALFKEYQAQLQRTAVFDSDDIALSSLGVLDAPIWRRRREREGFDGIFVDEAHLFSLNELSVVHHLLRSAEQCRVAFAIDRTQAIRELSSDTEELAAAIIGGSAEINTTSVRTVFRSALPITQLAQAVTAGGASLFTNFEDSLGEASSALTADEESHARVPSFELCANDAEIAQRALDLVDLFESELAQGSGSTALVVFDEPLLKRIAELARDQNSGLTVLQSRGANWSTTSRGGRARGAICSPDLVGGLEFDAVVLCGVDAGRVPPASGISTPSSHFLEYEAHGRLYVAISRARYRVVVLAERSRGLSSILSGAVANDLILEAGRS
jgi:superfamily I DNA/RNA helicase